MVWHGMVLRRPARHAFTGKDVHDHHFSKTAQPLSTKERERLSELGFNNPVGTTHNAEGFIRSVSESASGAAVGTRLTALLHTTQYTNTNNNSHSAQRALLRSLDHANNAHEAETMEVAALMGEFDALVQECGAMKVCFGCG